MPTAFSPLGGLSCPHKKKKDLGYQEIRIYYENVKIALRWSQLHSLLSRNKIFVIAVKNYAEAVIKVFCTCPILLDFFTLLQIFCPGLQTFPVSSWIFFRSVPQKIKNLRRLGSSNHPAWFKYKSIALTTDSGTYSTQSY